MHAVGLIQKALFFSKYTDIFGELPYSEAGNSEILVQSLIRRWKSTKDQLQTLT